MIEIEHWTKFCPSLRWHVDFDTMLCVVIDHVVMSSDTFCIFYSKFGTARENSGVYSYNSQFHAPLWSNHQADCNQNCLYLCESNSASLGIEHSLAGQDYFQYWIEIWNISFTWTKGPKVLMNYIFHEREFVLCLMQYIVLYPTQNKPVVLQHKETGPDPLGCLEAM